jgi:cytoskeleton protein RodZ
MSNTTATQQDETWKAKSDNKDGAPKDTVVAAGPGRNLKAAREKIGISAMEAASRINISLQQLNDLEADNYAELPAPIFVRNFLTRYAELLGLDGNKLLEEYEHFAHLNKPELARVSQRQAMTSRHVSVRWVTYAIVGAIVALAVVWVASLGVSSLWDKVSTEESAGGPVVNEISLPELSPDSSPELQNLPGDQ